MSPCRWPPCPRSPLPCPLPLCSPPFHSVVCIYEFVLEGFFFFFFLLPNPGDEITCHGLRCRVPKRLGEEAVFLHDCVPKTKEGLFSYSYSQGGESKDQSFSGEKGPGKEEAFRLLFLCSWVPIASKYLSLFPRSASLGQEADREGLSIAHLLLPLQSRVSERHPF